MRLPNGSRTPLTLGAMASVVISFVTFIYAEQQKTQEKVRQEILRKRTESIAQIERDKTQALAIQQQLLTGFLDSNGEIKNREFCGYVQSQVMASTNGLLGAYALRTFQSVMESEITGPDNNTQRIRWCECADQRIQFREKLSKSTPNLLQAGVAPQDLWFLKERLNKENLNCPAVKSSPVSGTEKVVVPSPSVCPESDQRSSNKLRRYNPRIYIQISSGTIEQQAIASDLNRALENIYGYKALGVETVDKSRAPSKPQLRYFDAEGEDIAKELLGQINSALACGQLKNKAVSYQFVLADFSRVRGKMRPYHFELWFPADKPIN